MKQILESLRENAQATAVEAKRQAELQKKLRRELPAVEFELGKQAFQIDYAPPGGERILASLKHLEEKHQKLSENDMLPETATWKEKAARTAEDAKKLVQKNGIRKQQKGLLHELGQAIHGTEASLEDSTLTTLKEKCRVIDSEIEALRSVENHNKSGVVKYLIVGLVCLIGVGVTYGAYRTFSGPGQDEGIQQTNAVASLNPNEVESNLQNSQNRVGAGVPTDGGGGGFNFNSSPRNTPPRSSKSSNLKNQAGFPQNSSLKPQRVAKQKFNPPPKIAPLRKSNSGMKAANGVAKAEVSKTKSLPRFTPPTRVLTRIPAPIVTVPASAQNLPPIIPLPGIPVSEEKETSQKLFGVFYVYPRFVGVEISWEEQDNIEKAPPAYTNFRNKRAREQDKSLVFEDNGTENRIGLSGTAKFFEIRNPEDSRFLGDNGTNLREFGECKIAGWRDSQLQTFSLWVTKWIEADSPYNSRTTISFRGVHSTKANQYAGWMNSKYYFVASPDEAVKTELIKRASEAMRFRNPERGNSYAKFEPTPVQLEAALKWLDMFKENIPLEKRERLLMGDHLKMAMTLYLSDEFAKAFGTSVDNLSFNDRLKYSFMFSKASQGRYGADAKKRAKHATAMVRLQTGDTGWAITVASVWMHRVFLKWTEEQLEKYRTETPHKASFDSMISFNKIAQPLRSSYFEYEQESFKKEFAQVTGKVADATLLSIHYSDDTPRERLSLLYKYASPDVSKKQKDRFQKIYLQQMIAKINQRLKELENIQDNFDAFDSTARWQSKFVVSFYTVRDEKPYKDAIDYVVKRRNRLASEFRDDLIAKMASTNSSSEVALIRNIAMPIRSDALSDDHKKIAAAADIHLARTKLAEQLERAERNRNLVLAMHSEQERSMMKENSIRITIPNPIPEPTQESIKFAYCREMSYLPGFSRVDPNTLKFAAPFLEKFASYILTVKKVDVEKVQRVAVNGDPNYFLVNYYIEVSFTRKGSINQLGPGSPQEKILDLLQLAAEKESKYTRKSDIFYLSKNGYRSETIRKEGMSKWR